jgi:uncharacterized protein (DUF488 family)
MSLHIVTIGVYGFESEQFFQALVDAQVDTFCDLRIRRAVRGSTYAFANSQRLQQRLQALGIRYLHCKDLAPTETIRALQNQEDKQLKVAKRARTVLAQRFIDAYELQHLTHFDAEQFVKQLGEEAKVAALFCVEREPEACHRSLVARRLERDLDLHVEHVMP